MNRKVRQGLDLLQPTPGTEITVIEVGYRNDHNRADKIREKEEQHKDTLDKMRSLPPESHRGPTLKNRPQHRAEDTESLERLRQQISITPNEQPLDNQGICPTVIAVEIRPLFSQTCTARIQKFPDGSGSPQMVLEVPRCF
eukprot:jgi/Chrzof1/5349/UNPLg00814.t1